MELRALEKKLKLMDAEKTKKMQELKIQHQADIQEFKNEVASKTSICDAAKDNMEQTLKSMTLMHREDISRLRQQLQQMNEKASHFENLHRNSQTESEKNRAHFEDEVKELNQDLRECRGRIKGLRMESSQYQDVIKGKDEIIKGNLNQIEKMNCQIQELTDEVHSVNQSYRDMLKENQELKVTNASLKTTVEFKSKELENSQSKKLLDSK